MGLTSLEDIGSRISSIRWHLPNLHLLGHQVNAWAVVLLLFVASRAVKFLNGLRAVNYMPGMRVLFQPMSLPSLFLPSGRWNMNMMSPWYWRFSLYRKYGRESISVVPFISGPPWIYTTNLEILRQVTPGRHKSSFERPPSSSKAFLLWGMNLFSAEGELWRKHRRIVGAAFNNDLYKNVWSETVATYYQMISAEGWAEKDFIDVPVVQHLTFKFALLVIGRSGFGFTVDWTSPPTTPDGSVSVQETLRIIADNILLLVFTPKWMRYLPVKRLNDTYRAFDRMMGFMKARVAQRKTEIRGQTGSFGNVDAFTLLVTANEDKLSKHCLDDDEVIGNIFVMLFAGHETTAHTLAATLGFLALHEDIQEEVYEQILSVVGYHNDPTWDGYSKLDKVVASFFEALRLFPAAFGLIRSPYEDAVLQIPNPPGEEGSTPQPIPKGVRVMVDMIGLQYNPRYFPEPEKFKPSRWYGLGSDSEQFTAFSTGPRACIGRKFAIVEAVTFLTMVLRDWRVEPILQENETKEAWRQRVLDAEIKIALGVKDVPLRFMRRAKPDSNY